jgi:hypothetical protein
MYISFYFWQVWNSAPWMALLLACTLSASLLLGAAGEEEETWPSRRREEAHTKTSKQPTKCKQVN